MKTDPPAQAQGAEPKPDRTWPYALGICVFAVATVLVSKTSAVGERVIDFLMASLNWIYGIGSVISLLALLFTWQAGDRDTKQ